MGHWVTTSLSKTNQNMTDTTPVRLPVADDDADAEQDEAAIPNDETEVAVDDVNEHYGNDYIVSDDESSEWSNVNPPARVVPSVAHSWTPRDSAHALRRFEQLRLIADAPIQERGFELICPITHTTIREPLFSKADGQIYESSAIRTWVQQKGTSPITRSATVADDLFSLSELPSLMMSMNDSARRLRDGIRILENQLITYCIPGVGTKLPELMSVDVHCTMSKDYYKLTVERDSLIKHLTTYACEFFGIEPLQTRTWNFDGDRLLNVFSHDDSQTLSTIFDTTDTVLPPQHHQVLLEMQVAGQFLLRRQK